ncbi:aldo/keto reductase [Clostridium sp. Cult3]|nr:aldo/keto reductase [Clostridium sp. Cult3]MCF6460049.1 aldo/keto reductase [Clostridium sp. Cult3]
MKRKKLGNTDIEVSSLCFGSLTMTPFQANLPVDEGGRLIQYAYDKGINFIDTAEIYDNYSYIREALKGIKREDFVISTKCYAYTKAMAKDSLELALRELNTDYIDIFLLHEQESVHTVRGHYEAIEYFLKAKDMGKIRAIGISTHRVEGVYAVTQYDELEVVHPIINKEGIGIQDGNVDDMLNIIKKAYNMGKGIYGMKPLGGGHLIGQVEEAFNFVKNIPFIHSFAIGMQSQEEIDCNINLMETGRIPKDLEEKLKRKKRRLIVADYCIACGNCVKTCKQKGIEIVDGKATPNENCILCGYCARNCPEFCIKVI